MNILCEIFGHQPPSKWVNAGGDYMKLARFGIDGIGREHALLYGECPRCRRTYIVGKTHLIPLYQQPVSASNNGTAE